MLGKSLFLPALNKMEVSFCLRHCQSSQGKSIFLRSVHFTVNLHLRLMMQSEMHSYVWVNIHKTSDFLKDSTLIFLFSFTTYQNLWLMEVTFIKEAQKGWADVAQRNVGEKTSWWWSSRGHQECGAVCCDHSDTGDVSYPKSGLDVKTNDATFVPRE